MVSSFLSKAAIAAFGTIYFAASTVNAEGEWLRTIKDCPQTCSSSGVKPGNWTAYHNTKKLARCKEPMLLDFLINSPIDDSNKRLKLLACSGSVTADDTTCEVGSESDVEVQSAWSGTYGGADSGNVVQAAEHTVSHLSKSDCSSTKPTTSFGYLNGSFVGVYSGGMMHNQGAIDLVKEFIAGIEKDGPKGDFQVTQICDSDRNADYIVGIAASIANTPGDISALAAVQKAVAGWSKGECAAGFASSSKTKAKVLQQKVDTLSTRHNIAARDGLDARDACKTTEVVVGDSCAKLAAKCDLTPAEFIKLHPEATFCSTLVPGQHVCCSAGTLSTRHNVAAREGLNARADCKTTQVIGGDGCEQLAARCGITPAAFTKLHPEAKFCSSLQAGQYVCCNAGTLPDRSPKPNADGSCHSYHVNHNDYCNAIAAANSLTLDDLEDFNKETWGWAGCDNLQAEMLMCLSTGDPPLPAPVSGNVCGPQVPGTKAPAKGVALATLNPCPLNACCDIWGQCGIDKEFCTITKSETGAPGTAKNGTNGCISNCGTDIVKGTAPKGFIKLGYYEAFNADRKCLNMDVRSLSGYSYTVIHFAFANITDNFDVDVSNIQQSFDHFKAMTGFKKIISFGGWSFSTSLDSYAIFRQGVTDAQRLTFAQNVVKFVTDNNLDGADFDWEYPGAPDVGVPGVPPGSPQDGPNYLSFLKSIKGLMPDGKTVSIAAPASYYYLKGFPIKDISKVVDYIVYMTYDLHGQWDYDNAWSNPGCDSGNCLRSHVNSTETDLALSMITKAGVDSGKVVVGVSSYGRSFEMVDPSCTGPHCLFTGPLSGATPGECTATPGYISNAELNDIVGKASGKSKRDGAVKTWHDDSSDSDMMTFGNTWVAFMTELTLAARQDKYIGNNFGGSTNWAVDLKEFVTPFNADNPDSDGTDYKHHYCDELKDKDGHDKDGKTLWRELGVNAAWDDAVANYDPKGERQFAQSVASFFNASDLAASMDCMALNVDNGCGDASVACQDVSHPAGYVILNSIANLDSLYYQLYTSIVDAKDDVWQDAENIADTFDPPPPSDETAQFILGLVENVWSMALSPGLGKGLMKAFGEGSTTKAFDKVNEFTDIGFEKIGDAISPKDNPVSAASEIQDQLKAVSNLWLKGMDSMNSATFDGKKESITNLKEMIDDGAFMVRQSEGAFEMRARTEKPMYAQVIPLAWSYDKGDKPRNPSGVFIVDSETACKAGDKCPDNVPGFPSDGLSRYMTTDAAQNTCHCYKENMYYLVQLFGLAMNPPVYPSNTETSNYFTTPPGLGDLDGKKWAGLTLAKFVEGSVNTYTFNGKKNGYTPDFKDEKTMQAYVDEASDDNAIAPGVIQIPVCTASEGWKNWAAVYDDKPKSANYPCD